MKNTASKLAIAAIAVTLLSAGASSLQARTQDVVKYGAIGVGALAVGSYYNNGYYNNGYYNNGYYNDGYYNSGYYGSGYYGAYNGGCGCQHTCCPATTYCQPSCGLFGIGFLGL